MNHPKIHNFSQDRNAFYTENNDIVVFPEDITASDGLPKNFVNATGTVATYKHGRDLIFGTENVKVSNSLVRKTKLKYLSLWNNCTFNFKNVAKALQVGKELIKTLIYF